MTNRWQRFLWPYRLASIIIDRHWLLSIGIDYYRLSLIAIDCNWLLLIIPIQFLYSLNYLKPSLWFSVLSKIQEGDYFARFNNFTNYKDRIYILSNVSGLSFPCLGISISPFRPSWSITVAPITPRCHGTSGWTCYNLIQIWICFVLLDSHVWLTFTGLPNAYKTQMHT